MINLFRKNKKPLENVNKPEANKSHSSSNYSPHLDFNKLLKEHRRQYETYKTIEKLQGQENKEEDELRQLLVIYRDSLNREINNVGSISKDLKEQSKLFKNIISIHSQESALVEKQNKVIKKIKESYPNINLNFKQTSSSSKHKNRSVDLTILNNLVMSLEANVSSLASNIADLLKLDKKNLLVDAKKIRDLSDHDHFKTYQKHRKQTIDNLNSVIKHLEYSVNTETHLSESISEMKADISKVRADLYVQSP